MVVTILLQNTVNGLAIGAIFAMIAMGFSFQFATTKVFNAAYGCNYLIAAYSYIAVVRAVGGPFGVVLAIAVAAVITSAFSVFSAILVYDRMRARSRGFYAVFLTSFGLLIITQNALAIPFGSQTELLGTELLQGPNIGAISISYCAILAVSCAIAVALGLGVFFFRSTPGMQLRAMADDDALVEVLDLPLSRYRKIVFAISGLVAVPPAILGTYLQGVSPSTGTDILTIAMAATIVGGVGSIVGAASAALILGLAENIAVWQLPGTWAEPVAFGLFFILITLKPNGISGRGWA